MANYYLNDDGTLTKEKKKKGKNYILQEDGSLRLSQEDIAPVKTSASKRTWFNSGLFEDGFDFEDIPKTLLGTNVDFAEDLSSGLAGIGEGIIDTVATGVGAIAKKLGKDDFADKTQKFIERDLVNEYKWDEKLASIIPGVETLQMANVVANKGDTEKVSVLGEKTDALVQSAGQLAGTYGLQAVGVPWWLTTGVTSFGGGAEEAFQNDATYGEAGTYGLINAGAEIISEKLTGGIKFGGVALDEGLKKTLTKGISNKVAKTLVNFGWDAAGEGFEEVFSEVMTNIGKKLTYEKESTLEELLLSEDAMDAYLESFIGGAVLGGGANVGKVARSAKTGRDYDTGLTVNEQSVVDAEVKKRITERQKTAAVKEKIDRLITEQEKTFGTLSDSEKKRIKEQVQLEEIDYTTTKISKKERTEIEKQVREDLEKGYIGIEQIESTLASGKTAEIKDLESQLTNTSDKVKKSEIQAKIKQLKADRATQLTGALGKDTYLQESYRQEALKRKEFSREVKEEDTDITKELLESAKNSKMNDTRRMHDLFEYTNKIANDTGTKYGFVNNEQLKQLGHDVDGRTINGLVRVNEDGTTKILINVDSDKSLNTIIGHETTHLFEGTSEYKALQDIAKEYAITKGEYDSRLKQIQSLYEGTNANIENEITADLVGDYLFTDEQFINSLSTKQPNVFQKIYDYIKHAYKMATAGSKEARQLEQLKRRFDKAYKEMSKATTGEVDSNLTKEADSNTKYSLNDNTVSLTSERIDSVISDYGASDKRYAKAYITSINPRDYLKLTISDKNLAKWEQAADEGTSESIYPLDEAKLKNERNIPMLEIDTETGEVIGHEGRHRMMALMRAGATNVPIVVVDNTTKYSKKKEPSMVISSQDFGNEPVNGGFTTEIRNLIPTNKIYKEDIQQAYGKDADIRFSLSDNQGRNLTKEQQAYFKDSKVRDENGNLLTMYHGTPNGDFTVFKDGTYFTQNKEYADRYQEPGASSISTGKTKENPKTYEVYLDIKKPFDINDPKAREVYINDYIKGGNAMGINPYLSDAEYNKIQAIDWTEGEDLRDFLIEEGYDYDGLILDEGADGGYGDAVEYRGKSYVVFSPEQVKSVDNANPTNNPDIRYSLSGRDGEYMSAVERGDTETAQRLVDEAAKNAGYTTKAYHGTLTKGITEFKKSFIGSRFSYDEVGFFFTDNLKLAEDYATSEFDADRKGEVISAYIKTSNAFIFDKDYAIKNGYGNVFRDNDIIGVWDNYQSALLDEAEEMRADSIIVKDGQSMMVVAFEPNQIKSAEPITYDNNGNVIPLSERFNAKKRDIRFSLSDSNGRELTKEQQEYFKDSKVRDEDGNLRVVYHGSSEDFTVFDRTKARANMDIQGNFFSPWDLDAQGYGENVRAFYLNITNPAPEDIAYKALNKFKGQNGAGIKAREYLESLGYDGVNNGDEEYITFYPHQIKSTDNGNPTDNPDINLSLSKPGEDIPTDGYAVYGRDVKLQEGIAPIREDIQDLKNTLSDLRENVAALAPEPEGYKALAEEDLPYIEQEREESFRNITEDSAPVEQEYYNMPDTAPLDDKSLKLLSKNMRQELGLKNNQVAGLRKIIQDFSTSETASKEDLYNAIESEFGTIYEKKKLDTVQEIKASLRSMKINVSDTIKSDIPDYFQFKQRNFGKIRFANDGLAVDDVYEGLKDIYPEYFPDNIANPTDQLLKIADVVNMDANYIEEYALPEEQIQEVTDFIYESISDYKRQKRQEASENAAKAPIDESMIPYEVPELVDDIAPVREDLAESDGLKNKIKVVEDNLGKEKKRLDDEYAKTLNPLKEEIKSKEEFISNKALNLYNELKGLKKGVRASDELSYLLDYGFSWKELKTSLLRVKAFPTSEVYSDSAAESIIRETIGREYEEKLYQVGEIEAEYKDAVEKVQKDTFETIRKLKEGKNEAEPEDLVTKTKKELRKQLLVDESDFFAKALDNAKNRSMILMNNTDTIRNTELVFGRENGKKINDLIFQKEIDNEAKSIAWQNKERAEIKDLGIKARSKESAAVQKWGEGKYVNEYGDEVEYTDVDLMNEFPDINTRQKIKNAANVIRGKYDNYIETANSVLTRLGFDPIQKRNDYMRHFQELSDVFSKYGIPFNAQHMKEYVLPTDINGLTEFWSPNKNYFANMQPRKGRRTTLDAITGIDGYISGVANLIYHTEDIQRGRAFEELIRDTYGEDKGWDNLENLPKEEQAARAEKIQDNHLSNYAAWVHEWTNNIAGKKNKLDRSFETMIGRKVFSFLDGTRKQTGANMIGFNASSTLTNFIAPIQAMAKTNKLAVAKGTADTIKNIFIKDNFAEKNSFLTSRMGTDMLSKTAWQKIQDAGFVFMKGTDWFAANQIVRSKYYELRSKGMSEEQAHAESGKFAARIMGDRTKGANAQLYNSKLFNIIGQFQLEVNNQLYSMFYDTYQESKENAQSNALRTAAGMTFTLGQLFTFTHVFGKTFESIAGYNPTFDIIGIIATALGVGDDDDDKTTSERLKDAADELVDALPYVSALTGGGRIPITNAIPNLIGVATGGTDDYGNELTLGDEFKKLIYLAPPTGGNQIRKTFQGLKMFDKDNPVPGSYTDSGNLRFPVEDTAINRIQAGIFGQWSNKNARDYFDNERQPLREKQIQEYKDLDLPIADYWEYREGLKDQKTVEDKFNYIADLDLPIDKKNIMINNAVDRDESIDLTNYDDFSSYEEFDYAIKNPEKYCLSRAVAKEFSTYKTYVSDLNDLRADKDSNGKTISGSRKEKVINYINGLNADYGEKIILFKSEYPADDTYNYEIIDYLNNRQDISYAEMETILKELGFQVDSNGNVRW